ncbi:MAG: U32 family peptidase [Desulfamplus sp.]|nr:U32 family peptidase [Desulfamplus sp.]
MHHKSNKPELLAPAGNFEKLRVAIDYGADAVYLSGKDYSLRTLSPNFADHELEQAILLARDKGVKTYLAVNIFARNSDLKPIVTFLERIKILNPDAVIIADPGIIILAQRIIPHIPIHLSTQANTTNINAVRFWQDQGISRINAARELSLSEIKEIVESTSIEIETFIHGAMCISYSGRCLLSSALSRRSSNQGLCSHPCRWQYHVMEEQRPGEFHPIAEDGRGTYIFNSRDLCMIDHIPALIDAGIKSFKIEGRMKGLSYLASTVKTYREAIDSYIAAPCAYKISDQWHDELDLIYHRPYSTGFYFHPGNETLPNHSNSSQGKMHSFTGIIETQLPGNRVMLSVKNKISTGDNVEILPFVGPPVKSKVLAIEDNNGTPIAAAQPNTNSVLTLEHPTSGRFIVRKI